MSIKNRDRDHCPICSVNPIAMRMHEWRIRFAWLPVRRCFSGPFKQDGWYWWRPVYEVRCGLPLQWTAYAPYNDNLLNRKGKKG